MDDNLKGPYLNFKKWLMDAKSNKLIRIASSMCLATVDRQGKPRARMVLLSYFDNRGFTFYTNSKSNKSIELTENPSVALCFYWEGLGRQIRIEGDVSKVPDEESDEYFDSSSIITKLSMHVSKQSTTMPFKYKIWLDIINFTLKNLLNLSKIKKRPQNFVGFRVMPNRIEFWQSTKDIINTRLSYTRIQDKWVKEYLYP